MLSERRKYCVTKKYDCSDCDFNKYHKDKECDDSFLEYRLKECYNQALEDFKEYLLRHKHLVREFETGHIYEAVKIEFITDTNSLFLKELNSK